MLPPSAATCANVRQIGSLTQADVVSLDVGPSWNRVRLQVEGLDAGLVVEQGVSFAPMSIAAVTTTIGIGIWANAHRAGAVFLTATGDGHTYLAQSGVAVFELVGPPEMGRVKGHATNVRLYAWNDRIDAPLAAQTDCIDIAEIEFDLSYSTAAFCSPAPCTPPLVFVACDGGC